MPFLRYARNGRKNRVELPHRRWPEQTAERAPLWCSVDLRDGNQALVSPMELHRKGAMFDLLCQLGFKQIEVGYPAASETEFAFVRELIEHDRIPDDVTISVFTPARIELIERTFESIRGARRAMVHLCLATACLWREVVFGLSAAELHDMTIGAAQHVAKLADAMPQSELLFEYSPETFNVTEPEFALAVSNDVVATWSGCPERPVTLNLPSTVETDSPNVYADQIEWMDRNLANRESVILSIHPHNDRGTAVASAELALMAGADRVEGTLFGNGERTGNVCLATLALNLFSSGVDPQLDFSDIDAVRRTVEQCNQMPVHARHPYAGDLVYTAFSGTHQDAIAKGLAAIEARGLPDGSPPPWQVPYLPIDPRDVGRAYESVVRLNSQSGKGGVAHVLHHQYGLDLPRGLRVEFAKAVQDVTERSGTELTSRQLWEVFRREYLETGLQLSIRDVARTDAGPGQVSLTATLVAGGEAIRVAGTGDTAAAAFVAGLSDSGRHVQLLSVTEHQVSGQLPGGLASLSVASYVELHSGTDSTWGAGIAASSTEAMLEAVLSAVSRGRPVNATHTANAR